MNEIEAKRKELKAQDEWDGPEGCAEYYFNIGVEMARKEILNHLKEIPIAQNRVMIRLESKFNKELKQSLEEKKE